MTVQFIKQKKTAGSVKGGALEKLAAKGQAKAVQEVIEPDPLSKLATEIENTPDQHTAHARATGLMREHALNYVELGGVLNKINENKWFGEHATFAEYCLNELGFSQVKAYYLIKIYKTLVGLGVAWSAVEEAGWSKVALLCSKFPAGTIDKEAFLERRNDAKTTPYKQLAEQLKGHAAADGVSANEVTTKIFKLHDDQAEALDLALDKAKSLHNTEYDSTALEYVALDYLSAPGKPKKAPPPEVDAANVVAAADPVGNAFVDQFQALGITKALERVAEVDSDSDAKEMVVQLLKDIGYDALKPLLELAFPDEAPDSTPTNTEAA